MASYGGEEKPHGERLVTRDVRTSTGASLSFGMTVLFGLFAVASIAACANAVLG